MSRLRVALQALALIVGLSLAAVVPASADPLTVDHAPDAGISQVTTSWSVAVADIDTDGHPDFLLGRHIDVARLYRGDGTGFTEIDEDLFLKRDRHDCASADVDQDGRVDFYCTIGADGGRIEKKNELWLQQADGTFIDQSTAFGVDDPFGRGRRVTFIDLNQDAYPDLFVGNTYPRKDDHRSPNRLFINVSGTHFREVHRSGVTRELGARCAQAIDVDADGWQDLLVCGKEGRPVRLYRNDHHNGFVDETAAWGVHGQAASAQIVDVDGNGTLDLVRVGVHSVRVQLGGPGGFRKAVYAQRLTNGAWVAIGDVNLDGLQDLYVVQGCGGGRNLIDYLLIGHGSGRFTSVDIPQTRDGCGGFAAPIDYDGDGRTEFLVLNGQGRRHGVRITGPVQLIGVAT
jgi:hypothetical protein